MNGVRSQVQALARSQPAFPMMPGMPEKRTHDYVRHGTTSLFAAFNIEDGTVISSVHRRHRTIEVKKFLTKLDSELPAALDVHLICELTDQDTRKSAPASRSFRPICTSQGRGSSPLPGKKRKSVWDSRVRIAENMDVILFARNAGSVNETFHEEHGCCRPHSTNHANRPLPARSNQDG